MTSTFNPRGWVTRQAPNRWTFTSRKPPQKWADSRFGRKPSHISERCLRRSGLDIHDDYLFPSLNAAYAELVVVASPVVVEAATALRKSVFDCFGGSKDCWPVYNGALENFQEAARAMLAEDVETVPSSA